MRSTCSANFLIDRPTRCRSALVGVASSIGLMLGQCSIVFGQTQGPTGWSVRNLHPAQYEASSVNGVGENFQTGSAFFLIDLESGPMGPWIEPHAGYWRERSGEFVDINPPAAGYSNVTSVWRDMLAGYLSGLQGPHAAVWTSRSSPVNDVHPAGFAYSKIFATNGRQHAGYAKKSPNAPYGEVAMLWTETSSEPVKLPTPSDANGAYATAISTNQQGGFVYFPYKWAGDDFRHAFLWNGAEGRAVDLHPAGAHASEIRTMTDSYQAGAVTLPSSQNNAVEMSSHAALWFGSPESLRVIGPPGSYLVAACGSYQVGVHNGHATLWASSADSAFDLHGLLPDGYSSSAATSIWTDGQRIVIGGCADSRAVLWSYTPAGAPIFTAEPQSITVAAGSRFILSASAAAPGPVSFQWQRDGVDIAGATRPMLLGEQPGLYTVVATSRAGATQSAPAVVSQTVTTESPRLANLSVRTHVGPGNFAVAGFVIAGSTAKTILIRAIGPGLSALRVPEALANPSLQLFSGSTLLCENDDWGGSALLDSIGASTGAFPVGDRTSKDAMLAVTLPPGSYTAHVSGVGNATGTVLVEIYEVL